MFTFDKKEPSKDDSFPDHFLKLQNLPLIFKFSAIANTDQQAKKAQILKRTGDLLVHKTELRSYHL